jgi:hypothetical protein
MRSIGVHSKSILTSTVFWSVVLLLCQAIGPHVDRALSRGNFTLSDAWAIFQACVTALVGVIARYNVGDMHTPKGLPGADPPIRPRGGSRQQDDLVRGIDNGVSGEYRYSSYTVHDTSSEGVPLRRIPRLLTDDDSV